MRNQRAYRWKDASGSGGIIYAKDKRSAKLILYNRGMSGITLKRSLSLWMRTDSIPAEELTHFLQQLSVIVQCGVSISPALNVLLQTSERKKLRNIIMMLQHHMENGASLSKALALYPKAFDPTVRALIHAGEQSATFVSMLERASQYLRHTQKLRKQIRQALFYPALVAGISILVAMVLLIKVVPSFSDSFAAFDMQLPQLTLHVISGSDYLRTRGANAAIFILISVLLLYQLRHNKILLLGKALLYRRIPVWSSLMQSICTARFCMVAANTLSAKIPIAESLQLAASACGDPMMTREIELKLKESRATTLHACMAGNKYFPPLLVHMLGIAENTGRLESTFNFLTAYYEEQVQHQAHRLSVLIEPFMMLLLGMFIGILILAMYLPIFELGSMF